MGDFRTFPANSEETAKRCSELLCADEFEITGDRRGSGSGAHPVKVSGPFCPAWAKPTNIDAANVHAVAHEKIVSDLANKLGFPVSPVMISEKTKDKKFNNKLIIFPNKIALSFDVLSQPKPWSKIEASLTDKHKASLCPQISAALALHCWVDDHDHNWNDGNALFEIDDDGSARAVFYDYAWSLSHEWKPPSDAPKRDWKGRGGPYALTEMSQIIAAVELIQRLEVKDLKAIIERIPPDCMSSDLGKAFINALDQRRALLPELLNLAGAP